MKTTTKAARPEERSQAFVAFFVLVAGLVFWLASGMAHAAPPAGTVIGNQATATYNDAGGTPRVATSNLVQVTVSQVKSFTLTANGAQTASSGQTVYYPHTITNTGNGTDTYTLNAPTTGGAFAHTGLVYYVDSDGNGVPDNFVAINTSGPIAMAGIFRFVVAATVPGSATNGQTGTVVVSVSDTAAPVNTITNTDTTTVANSSITVTKALSQISGGSPNAGPITVTLSYTNTGSAPAANVELRDALPAGMTYIANSGRWSVTGATVLTDANAADNQGGIVYDFNVSAANRVTATIGTVAAGFSGNLTFQVSINAGLPPGFVNNTAQYQTTTQGLTSTNTASYQVVQTAGVVANGSTTNSTNGTAEPVTVASAAAGSLVSFTNVIWNTGNAADTFVIALSGTGTWPIGSTFTLYQSDGVTSLIANTTPSIPVFAAGCAAGFETDAVNQRCGYRVILRVQLPASATGGPYTATKTATSSFDNTRVDTVNDVLTAVAANTVDITNNTARADSAPAGTANAGNAATTGFGTTLAAVITTNTVTPSTTGPVVTRFQLYVNNTGAISDTFNLSFAGVPAGWAVQFRADGGAANCSTVGGALVNTGVLAAGANRLVCAEVSVPATTSNQAAPGNYDLDFTATSSINGGVSDVKRDRVTVNAVNSVNLTPNNAQQTFAGGSVTYTHVITNIGNVNETISFQAGFVTDTLPWGSIAYLDGNANGVFDPGVDDVPANQISVATTFPLAVNATRTLFVRVFVPGGTPGGTSNVTTLTARYNAGTASTFATDTTSVTDGLVLLKEQVAVACAAAGPHAGYSTAAIPAGPSTAPGQCIAYRISGSNTTAANITAVVINDNIPANTRQRNSCGAPATTVGTITSPGDGATGTISATVGPLTPAQSVVVTFCVRIDP